MTERELAQVIAKCERCGRGFCTLPRHGMRDRYPPVGTPPYALATARICRGLIVEAIDGVGEIAGAAKETER